jgi:hypothetical protein
MDEAPQPLGARRGRGRAGPNFPARRCTRAHLRIERALVAEVVVRAAAMFACAEPADLLHRAGAEAVLENTSAVFQQPPARVGGASALPNGRLKRSFEKCV